jgi:hypothetical protein
MQLIRPILGQNIFDRMSKKVTNSCRLRALSFDYMGARSDAARNPDEPETRKLQNPGRPLFIA